MASPIKPVAAPQPANPFSRILARLRLGPDHPVLRLIAYYIVLALAIALVTRAFPAVAALFSGDQTATALSRGGQALQDGLPGASTLTGDDLRSRLLYAGNTMFVFAAAIALMLPVSWVYMSARKNRAHSQHVVQTLIVLPIVVAGIVMIVHGSLSLAFSLAGVVAAVRFRTSLSDPRDVVYIFLGIAVGFAAGVHLLTVAVLLSVCFNFIFVLIWRYDFGRNLLTSSAGEYWNAPLEQLATVDSMGDGALDRDLVLALTPQKADVLTARFERVKRLLGTNRAKPRYDAVVKISTENIALARSHVEQVLTTHSKRYRLDELINHLNKPSALFYLVKMRKSIARDALEMALRDSGGESLLSVDIEVGEALEHEQREEQVLKKQGLHQA